MCSEDFCEHKTPIFDKFSIINGVRYVICKRCGLPVETTGEPVGKGEQGNSNT